MAGPTKTAESRRRQDAPGARRPPSDSGTPPAGRSGRRRPGMPGRRPLALAAALTVALAGSGVWALYGSDWLRVEHVGVSGTRVLTERQVRDAADVPVGAPLVSVDRAGLERRLAERLPRIASAEAVRAWPDGIGLHVTERVPELALKKGGRYVEVDKEGVRFATVPRLPKGVPLLKTDLERTAGLRHFGAERLRREAVRVAAALPEAVHRDTRAVRVRTYDSITLELTGGRTVMWGSGERGAAKAGSLTALMKAEPEAEHFDVSVPSAPAVSGS